MNINMSTDKEALTSISSLAEQGRAVIFGDGYYPVLQVIGFVVVLYFLFYLITFYVGPAIFGHRPTWKRSLDVNGMPPMMVVNPLNSAQLTESVHSALEKQYQ